MCAVVRAKHLELVDSLILFWLFNDSRPIAVFKASFIWIMLAPFVPFKRRLLPCLNITVGPVNSLLHAVHGGVVGGSSRYDRSKWRYVSWKTRRPIDSIVSQLLYVKLIFVGGKPDNSYVIAHAHFLIPQPYIPSPSTDPESLQKGLLVKN